ncbi:conjugal transfer protein TraF [Vibrio sinaloensis]|uniref:conjugal transfer protein TraF n=1 Tax=Photobacterium sp. (strain ATCC 43367) TaxID=379097 RepID=UPI0035EE487D
MRLLCTLFLFLSVSLHSAHAGMQNQYALVFFFDSTCNFCHRTAPKITLLGEQFQLPIYAFSVNGKGIPGFEVPIPVTPDIARTFFPQTAYPTLPATFLINVNSRKFARLSEGDVSLNQLSTSIQSALSDPRVLEALQ